MTDADDLLSKADALLARRRAGTVAPSPPADYPVLTEVVDAPPVQDAAQAPRIPAEPEMPEIYSAGAAAASEIAALDSLDAPLLDAPQSPPAAGAPFVPLAPVEDLPTLPPLESSSARPSAESRSLEERIRSRVLEALEPSIQNYLDDPLRARLEDLTRQLAVRLAADARRDIISLVHDAVKDAVTRELASQRDAKPGGS